jgi:hypothetical protein
MELVVLLLIVSLGVNVLLGLRTVKLSNKKDSAEIIASEYKNKADYWRKQYEANKECKAYESIQKSQSILEEAFNELGAWYKNVCNRLKDAEEDYATLAEQYNHMNEMVAMDAPLHEQFYRILELSLHNRELYDLLIDIDPDLYEGLYVVDRAVLELMPGLELATTEYGQEYFLNLYSYDHESYYLHPRDLAFPTARFYFDYVDEIERPMLESYM